MQNLKKKYNLGKFQIYGKLCSVNQVRRLVGIDYESHRDTKRVFHESLSLVNNYQRETMIELTLVKIETEGCTESIADVHREVRGSRL